METAYHAERGDVMSKDNLVGLSIFALEGPNTKRTCSQLCRPPVKGGGYNSKEEKK